MTEPTWKQTVHAALIDSATPAQRQRLAQLSARIEDESLSTSARMRAADAETRLLMQIDLANGG